MNSVTIFGVRIDDIDPSHVAERFATWLAGNEQHVVVTPNPEFLLAARHDAAFRAMLGDADLALPDGVGLRFAAAALADAPLCHRTTGVDALWLLAECCARARARLLLVAGASGTSAVQALRQRFPQLDVAAVHPGVVSRAGELPDDVLATIRAFAPAAVAVCLGQGKQEACMARFMREWPSVRIAIGVGGACDMIAGHTLRAPAWMRRRGLEWVWRLVREPRRVRRMVNASIVFPALVVWDTLRQGRFLQASRKTVPEIVRQLFGV